MEVLAALIRRSAALAAIATFAGMAAAETAPLPAPRQGRVVLLRSSDSQLPAFIAAESAFRATLAAQGETRLEIFPEDLGTWQFSDGELDAELLTLLHKKYGKRSPQVVIASGSGALRFADRHHDALWPEATLIFNMVDDNALEEIQPKHAKYGVTTRLGIGETLKLASRLLPATKRVVFISGTADIDREFERNARREAQLSGVRLETTFVNNLTLAQALELAAVQTPGTILFSLVMFRDAGGHAQLPGVVAGRIADAASVPTFYFVETGIGRGVLGGYVVQPGEHGRLAAQIAISVLSHEAVPGRAYPSAPLRCILDGRQLNRWNIEPGRVPADCDVRFHEATFWELHGMKVVVAAVIMSLQALLIGLLVVQLRRRRAAELETQRRTVEAAHSARLATVGELTASIAHEINQPLTGILSNADAAGMILDSDPGATAEIQQVLEDIRVDGLRASEVISRLRALLGRREIRSERVDANHVIAETIALLRGEAARRGVRIFTTPDPALPGMMGDPVQFQQVILNYIVNAMDAMAGTPAETRVIHVRTAADAGGVLVQVDDAGPGIPPANLPRVFDSFFTTKESGLGLGLSIVRTIVEAHSGRVSAENLPGRGARFSVWLPAGSA